jgi:hypothetical protein
MDESVPITVTFANEQGKKIIDSYKKLGYVSPSDLIRTAVREFFNRKDLEHLTGDFDNELGERYNNNRKYSE